MEQTKTFLQIKLTGELFISGPNKPPQKIVDPVISIPLPDAAVAPLSEGFALIDQFDDKPSDGELEFHQRGTTVIKIKQLFGLQIKEDYEVDEEIRIVTSEPPSTTVPTQ